MYRWSSEPESYWSWMGISFHKSTQTCGCLHLFIAFHKVVLSSITSLPQVCTKKEKKQNLTQKQNNQDREKALKIENQTSVFYLTSVTGSTVVRVSSYIFFYAVTWLKATNGCLTIASRFYKSSLCFVFLRDYLQKRPQLSKCHSYCHQKRHKINISHRFQVILKMTNCFHNKAWVYCKIGRH